MVGQHEPMKRGDTHNIGGADYHPHTWSRCKQWKKEPHKRRRAEARELARLVVTEEDLDEFETEGGG